MSSNKRKERNLDDKLLEVLSKKKKDDGQNDFRIDLHEVLWSFVKSIDVKDILAMMEANPLVEVQRYTNSHAIISMKKHSKQNPFLEKLDIDSECKEYLIEAYDKQIDPPSDNVFDLNLLIKFLRRDKKLESDVAEYQFRIYLENEKAFDVDSYIARSKTRKGNAAASEIFDVLIDLAKQQKATIWTPVTHLINLLLRWGPWQSLTKNFSNYFASTSFKLSMVGVCNSDKSTPFMNRIDKSFYMVRSVDMNFNCSEEYVYTFALSIKRVTDESVHITHNRIYKKRDDPNNLYFKVADDDYACLFNREDIDDNLPNIDSLILE